MGFVLKKRQGKIYISTISNPRDRPLFYVDVGTESYKNISKQMALGLNHTHTS
jgi:hypothetical protein